MLLVNLLKLPSKSENGGGFNPNAAKETEAKMLGKKIHVGKHFYHTCTSKYYVRISEALPSTSEV